MKYRHLRNPLRRLDRTLRITGHQVKLETILQCVENPNSGHPVALAFRSKWQKKQYGKLDEWIADGCEMTEEPAEEGPVQAKPSVQITDRDHIETTVASDVATGLWDSDKDVRTACGTVGLLNLSSPLIHLGAVLKFQWAHTTTTDRLKDQDWGDDQGKRALVMDAVRAHWPIEKYGPLESYRMQWFTFDYARLNAQWAKRIECK